MQFYLNNLNPILSTPEEHNGHLQSYLEKIQLVLFTETSYMPDPEWSMSWATFLVTDTDQG